MKRKFGGESEELSLCCWCNGVKSDDSEVEEGEKGEGESGRGEGDLVAIDKGFNFELDELLRASAYVLGKSGLGIVYKVVKISAQELDRVKQNRNGIVGVPRKCLEERAKALAKSR